MKRIIPSTMATQHPDNAAKPYWHSRPFVSTNAEIRESFLCYSDLGIDEYNWDWEGKFVDEAVIDRLLHQHFAYFQKNPLGKNKFLTFRFPNPRVEKQFRLARALMVAITSSQLARSLGFNVDPVFEAILPLTESAGEIIDIQEAFKALVGIEHKLLKLNQSINHIEIIPLFEDVGTIINSDRIIREYVDLHKKAFGQKPEYLRPYIARSDPALNSGLIPTILALKIALSRYKKLSQNIEVPLYPMLGTGSLPFRGGLSPQTVEKSLDEYAGISTLIIQSAFRYDYPRSLVIKAIKTIKEKLPHKKAVSLEDKKIDKIISLVPKITKPYRQTVESIAPLINDISKYVAKRRERMLHIGLFGYSRGLGEVQLPRAITYTAVLYSIGIPPELIGSGRGLKEVVKSGSLELVSSTYRHLVNDLSDAGHFLNKDNLQVLARQNSVWKAVQEDVSQIEKIFHIELGYKNATQKEHYNLTARTLDKFLNGKNISPLITLTGQLRQSLG
ncbi:phosphoenolpyruvate carboxylase [Candidatus Gottesmanbacteria bacterium RBG_16_37_8]|uniref:Phosphoenolpyruvate carboxylase n=1 Tax=Candidatus Gottesmanbacteria bacterium RBG_16_37_8 TaxID=1798371 RepID=A0A1F5YRF8_9BACT|nr:MAG: phosphoenolpyruvate carboxylase [Candidatus Gottesmanbacteria bacterium RBG_16_37_8]